MNLYTGKVLFVDLSTGKITTEPLREDWAREYWGSFGLAARYYWDVVKPDVEPFSPENALVIMPGTLTGTLAPMTGRTSMTSKSPVSKTVFSTNIGGHFAPELKFAGYDGLIIKGQAKEPVYLQILDDKVTIESAADMAGKGILETEEMMVKKAGDPEARCLAIGPAGENKVGFAIVATEAYRQMGRSGGGALFGSKNLKGIVCRGTGGVKVADMKAFVEKCTDYKKNNLRGEDNEWMIEDGTPGNIDFVNELGLLPTHNFKEGTSEKVDGIGNVGFKPLKVGDRACAACPMACSKFTRKGGLKVEGPEYETLALGGSNCGVFNMETVIRFNALCDDLGLDTMSAGNVISMAMEMTEEGRADFGLKFGDEQYTTVLEEIAHLSTERGRDLASGSRAMGEKFQSSDMAMEAKGLEFPAYDPRANYGMGIAYATAERGADHNRALTMFCEDVFNVEHMVDEVIGMQDFNSIKWSLGFCEFWGTLNNEIFADLLSCGLGEEVTVDELVRSGVRSWNLYRLFNVAVGFDAKDDTLPDRVLKRKLEKGGPADGRVLSPEDFELSKQLYYKKRSWDTNGIPTPEIVAELGLDAFKS